MNMNICRIGYRLCGVSIKIIPRAGTASAIIWIIRWCAVRIKPSSPYVFMWKRINNTGAHSHMNMMMTGILTFLLI